MSEYARAYLDVAVICFVIFVTYLAIDRFSNWWDR